MRGERQLSEHELRFQRSLRNLNTPEWYKKSSTKPETTLRRDYGSGSLAGTENGAWITGRYGKRGLDHWQVRDTGSGRLDYWQAWETRSGSLAGMGNGVWITDRYGKRGMDYW